ncbi:hypothetical protein M3J09_013554 [Ascochyta lentis]
MSFQIATGSLLRVGGMRCPGCAISVLAGMLSRKTVSFAASMFLWAMSRSCVLEHSSILVFPGRSVSSPGSRSEIDQLQRIKSVKRTELA